MRVFFEFRALLCVFLMGFFMRLGPDFSRFGYDLCKKRNRILDKIVFRLSRFFFLFSSACFFDIISFMSPQVLAKYF